MLEFANSLKIKDLGKKEYTLTYNKMRDFTDQRNQKTIDEIWLVEHFPVFTQGLAGKEENVLITQNHIPIIRTDRGGQITYHGPGQLVVYLCLDIKRKSLGIKTLINKLENSIIELLKTYDIAAHLMSNAPGVYVKNKKICSLGLKWKKGYIYHGLALNIDLDLEPFNWINPCGYHNLKMTKISELNPKYSWHELKNNLALNLVSELEYNEIEFT